MSDIYSERKQKALNVLLQAVGGRKSLLAKELEVSEQTIQMWFLRGQISKKGAVAVSNHEFLSERISKQELRPDVSW